MSSKPAWVAYRELPKGKKTLGKKVTGLDLLDRTTAKKKKKKEG